MVLTIQPTSSFFWHYISPYNTRLLEYGANNSCNYILNDFVDGLTKESDNKNSKNGIDKGKAKNYDNRSDNNNNNIDNNNFRDSNSSNNNKGNKACRYIK